MRKDFSGDDLESNVEMEVNHRKGRQPIAYINNKLFVDGKEYEQEPATTAAEDDDEDEEGGEEESDDDNEDDEDEDDDDEDDDDEDGMFDINEADSDLEDNNEEQPPTKKQAAQPIAELEAKRLKSAKAGAPFPSIDFFFLLINPYDFYSAAKQGHRQEGTALHFGCSTVARRVLGDR